MSNAVKRDATAPVPAVSSKVQLIRGLVGNTQQPSETRFFPAQNKAPPTTRIEQNQPENVCKESESKGKLGGGVLRDGKLVGDVLRGLRGGCLEGFLTEATQDPRRGKGHGLGIIGIDDLPKAA